jgi:exoribonuclease R
MWTVGLDSEGEITSASVQRAIVRSRERLSYGEVQSALVGAQASQTMRLLAQVGRLRQEGLWGRGGVSLEVPEQQVAQLPDGSFSLSYRRTVPVEGWNAQISLLVGIAAARIMRAAGVGILRTLPPADPRDVARLRRTAGALGIEWPADWSYGDLLRRLDSRKPAHAAFLAEATTLFRGAGYLAFGLPGVLQPLETEPEMIHSAIGAEYAHVTAPLRRLADRYATEVCLAYCSGRDVPRWVTDALPALPATMAATGLKAARFEHACVEIVEAALLEHRVGQQFDGVIVEVDDTARRGEVVLRSPAVRARVDGESLPLGERVRVTLAEACVADRRVRFTPAW